MHPPPNPTRFGVNPAVSFLKTTPNAFKTFLDYEPGCYKIAEYWRVLGISKVAVFKAITESGELCLNGMRRVFPDAIVEEFTWGSDVTPQILRLKTKSPEAIMTPALEADALNLFRALKGTNWKPHVGFDVRDSLTERVRSSYPDFVRLAVGFGFALPPPELAKKLRERSPDMTNLGLEAGALAYLHVRQMWQALNACPRFDVECAAEKLQSAGSDDILEFQGWKERVARFRLYLFKFKDGELQEVRG